MASILVIDVERDAHVVETADNSRAGLQLFETQKFDLLIIDIFMPGMDGFETMNLVHQFRPEVPIIIMSGQQFRSASERAPDFLYMATKLGAVSSLQKPFKPHELQTAVIKSLPDGLTPVVPTDATQGETRGKMPPD
jgi:CheY-like chemotaxis protein